MSRASKWFPVAVVAPILLTLGCGMPLPAADLTATAESQPRQVAETRSGSGGIQAASAGPLNLSSDDGDDSGAGGSASPIETPTPVATATPGNTKPSPTPEPAAQPENYAPELLAAVNSARTERGLAALTVNGSLNAAAASFAQYMGQANFFGHYGPDGSSPQSRIAGAGFKGQYKGETLTAGQASPGAALGAFLNSAAHAAILMDSTAAVIGVGYYYAPASTYKHYWVVILAKP